MKRKLTFVLLLFCASAYAQIGRGVVTGRILTIDGKPAAGLRVAAMEVPDGNRAVGATSLLASIALTDSDGRYRLEDIPPGRYYIVAGKIDTPTFYPGTKTAGNAKTVSVIAGGTAAAIDFAATPPLRVTGRVIGLSAAALAAAPGLQQLNIQLSSQLSTFLLGARSNAIALNPVRSTGSTTAVTLVNQQQVTALAPDGSFEFRDVPPGEYTVVLQGSRQDYIVRLGGVDLAKGATLVAAGGGAVRLQPMLEVNPAKGATLVVAERDVTDVIVAFPSDILGSVVVDQGGPAPSFVLTFKDPDASPIQVSASTARPLEASLLKGNYSVAVSGLADGYDVKAIEYGSTDVLHAPLVITDTSNLDNRLVVKLGVSSPPPWVSIRGRVTGAGRPAAAGPLMFGISSDALGLEFQSPLQPDGSFEFARVPAGTYEAWFDPEPDGINPIAIVVGKSDLTNVEIPLAARVRISVKVMVDDDAPLPGGRIRLVGTRAARAASAAEVFPLERVLSLSANGAFSTVLPEGEYRMAMEGPATPYGVRSVTDGTVNLLTEPLRVTGGGAKEISVRLSVMTFAVIGRVYSGGRSLPDGMEISITGTGLTVTHYASVRADGSFEFARIPPGTYWVRAGQEGMPIAVDVTTGNVSGVDFALLKGKAVFPPDEAPPAVVLSFSIGDGTASSYVRPHIRADGGFESLLPVGAVHAHLSGYLPHYVLKLVRDGKSSAINDGAGFEFTSREDFELQVIFQP